MERITKQGYNSVFCGDCDCHGNCSLLNGTDFIPGYLHCLEYKHNRDLAIRDKLTAYEDAEEQGRLVKLPCRIGDTAYRVDLEAGAIQTITLDAFHIVGEVAQSKRDYSDCLLQSEWGKTIFLSYEEAEAALAEMKVK